MMLELISGGFWRPAAAAAGESKALLLMGCTASALCVSLLRLERDANAMHFALEPASSARLGFVFFMQLPARRAR